MSDRLTWSDEAALLIPLLSRARLHAYVEGSKLDPYFYGTICELECSGLFDYRLVQSHEIKGAGGHGGKEVLLEEFTRLRRRGGLEGVDDGHGFTTIFFLDKDVDDVLRRSRRSRHVVYTPAYNVEGMLFRHGNIERAVAAAASVDPGTTGGKFGSGAEWTEGAVQSWREWAVLCLFATLVGGHQRCGYSRPSAVNRPASAPADPFAVLGFLSDVSARSSESHERCLALLRKSEAVVQRRLDAHRGFEIFNGRWFAPILDDHIRHRLSRDSAPGSLSGSLISSLVTSLDFSEAWAGHFRAPVRELLDSLSAAQ